MDLHRLAEERSIAYHRAIAARLQERPEVLKKARQRVEGWLSAAEPAPFYARKWHEILSGDLDGITAFLADRGQLATELRQSSPFAGALTPQERWSIWRRVRDEMAAALGCSSDKSHDCFLEALHRLSADQMALFTSDTEAFFRDLQEQMRHTQELPPPPLVSSHKHS